MDKAQKGFTLIELVVVITILGILAAFAFPRFAALEVEARKATINGLAGSVRSAASLAHSMDLVSTAPVVMEGVTITMQGGYPEGNATGITATMQDITGFTGTYTGAAGAWQVVYEIDGAGAACDVTYLENAAAAPTITLDVTTC